MKHEMTNKRVNHRRILWSFVWCAALVLSALGLSASPAVAQDKKKAEDGQKTILVTAVTHNERTRSIAKKLQPVDFVVTEKKISQRIVSVSKASKDPVILAVLVQDNLVSRVNNEIRTIKKFIRGLPEGSSVMTAYVSSGSLRVKQDFTTDIKRAADSLRIIPGSQSAAPFSPYIQVREAVKKFRAQPVGRRMILLVSDGLDNTFGLRRASPFFSVYLDSAIFSAQREDVVVFAIYAPPAGGRRYFRRALNAAQGSLLRLADETGGEAFFSGSSFVTFDPYFRELGTIMKNQWLITYRSSNTGKGFREIEVTTDFDIDLQHLAGYRVN